MPHDPNIRHRVVAFPPTSPWVEPDRHKSPFQRAVDAVAALTAAEVGELHDLLVEVLPVLDEIADREGPIMVIECADNERFPDRPTWLDAKWQPCDREDSAGVVVSQEIHKVVWKVGERIVVQRMNQATDAEREGAPSPTADDAG